MTVVSRIFGLRFFPKNKLKIFYLITVLDTYVNIFYMPFLNNIRRTDHGKKKKQAVYN